MRLVSAAVFLGLASFFALGLVNQPSTNLTSNNERAQLDPKSQDPSWAAFEMSDLIAQREEKARPYLSFLQVSTLSAGLYVLPEGGVDHQEPHDQDELYYVVSGRASLQVADETIQISPGSVVYVRARVEHRFLNIEEELSVLVFFSAAEAQ